MIKAILYSSYLIALLLLFVQCDTNEPPTNSTITLKLEDVSCTEARIKLTTTNLQLPATVTIKQNNQTRSSISLVKPDTILFIDSLLPNQTYQYQVSSVQHQVSSNELNVTTLDTTSHNFTWQTWTFGEHSTSILYDVTIIDENNIWAVGEIYLNDSLGQTDPKRYNALIWNGNNWDIIRISYNYQGTDFYHPIQSVFAFGPNDIWFCGNGVIHWDGNSFIPVTIPANVWGPYQMNKLWGRSNSDLYVVGNNGNIAHYQNSTWSRIESGTSTNINDVWGITDTDGLEKIYCAVSFVFQSGDQKILTIKNDKVDSLSWNSGRRVHSVWTNSKNYVYIAGGGIFENKNGYWNEITQVPHYYSRNIREKAQMIFLLAEIMDYLLITTAPPGKHITCYLFKEFTFQLL